MLDTKVKNWLSKIGEERSFPGDFPAIYVGIFESESTYFLHFLGSHNFDSEDGDWACEEDGDFIPANQYLNTEVSSEEDWVIFEQKIVQILTDIKKSEGGILKLVKHIAVGFDEGELSLIP
ncbi:hypothetical protein HOF92_09245 [bacterium]|jgi:hypothetical protein|nr:hypothetical protein [bacterium]